MDIGYAATAEGGEDYSVEDVHAVSPSTRCFKCDGWVTFFSRVSLRCSRDWQRWRERSPKGQGQRERWWQAGTHGRFVQGLVFLSEEKTGHRANECTERVANSLDEVGEDDAGVSSISGVWMAVVVDSKEDRGEVF